jgi:outer membrane protein assembly factor BamA
LFLVTIRTLTGSLFAILLFGFAFPAGGQILLRELRVQGNGRLKEAAIIAASGLRRDTDISRGDLDAAAQRLSNTGLFTAVNYSYAPLPVPDGSTPGSPTGYSVTLTVVEERATQTVVLDIPGVDSQQVWTQLIGNSLLDRVIPSQQTASVYYIRELESFLSKAGQTGHLIAQEEADLITRQSSIVIQLADAPVITDLRFEGNMTVSTQAIRDKVFPLTAGNRFSERDFRLILESNVRPMFEENALLQLAFSSVRATGAGNGKVIVTTTIDEKRAWRLGKVAIEGDDLPSDKMLAAGNFATGRAANWTDFLAGVQKMEALLKHDGFMNVSSQPVRMFQEATGLVDVTIIVRKGKQYRFA